MEFDDVLTQIKVFATNYGIQIVGALLILVAGRIAAGIVRKSLLKLCDKRNVDPSISGFIASLTYISILMVTLLATLSKFGVQTASFVAVLGAAGFAVGFALQGSLSNFASGILILLLRPFKVGDYIEAGGVEGAVKAIDLFVTELTTLDNIKVLVPNGQIMAGNIRNLSGYGYRRVNIAIGIAYGASIAKARDIAIEVAKQDPRVLETPTPDVVVSSWGDSSVNLYVWPYVEPKDYWPVFFALSRKIKEAYDANGIEIPFPQRVVHMAKDKDKDRDKDKAA